MSSSTNAFEKGSIIALSDGADGTPNNAAQWQEELKDFAIHCFPGFRHGLTSVLPYTDKDKAELTFSNGSPVYLDAPEQDEDEDGAGALPHRLIEPDLPLPKDPGTLSDENMTKSSKITAHKFRAELFKARQDAENALARAVDNSLSEDAKNLIGGDVKYRSLPTSERIKRAFDLFPPAGHIEVNKMKQTIQVKLAEPKNLLKHVSSYTQAYRELKDCGLPVNEYDKVTGLMESIKGVTALDFVIQAYNLSHPEPRDADFKQLSDGLVAWYKTARPDATSAEAGYAMQATAKSAALHVNPLEAKVEQLSAAILALTAGMSNVQQKQDKAKVQVHFYCFTHGDNRTHDSANCRGPNEAHTSFVEANRGRQPGRNTPLASTSKPGDGWATRKQRR